MNEIDDFAAGRWSAFHGLADCRLDDAAARLPAPADPAPHGGRFGGGAAMFLRYPGIGALGLTVWALGESVIGLELLDPEAPDGARAALGAPEAVVPSELGADWSQELWGSRGLVMHRRDEQIRVVFGLAQYDIDAWDSDPLRWWRIERIRR